jgi:hypothetical protein
MILKAYGSLSISDVTILFFDFKNNRAVFLIMMIKSAKLYDPAAYGL